MFPIEKGIDLPAAKSGPNACKYPFRRMEIGDSFAVPTGSDRKVATRVSVSVRNAAKRLGRQFATRRTGEVIRVWRTA